MIRKLTDNVIKEERCLHQYNVTDVLKELNYRKEMVNDQFVLASSRYKIQVDTMNEASAIMGEQFTTDIADRVSGFLNIAHEDLKKAEIIYDAEMGMINYCINVVENNSKPAQVLIRREY